MDKVKLELTLHLDGDCDQAYVQELAEKVANALQHEANDVGLSPDNGPCIERIRVNSLSDAVSGEHFRIAPVERTTF